MSTLPPSQRCGGGRGRVDIHGASKPVGMTPFDWACACRDSAETEVERLRGYVRENQTEARKAWAEVHRLREDLLSDETVDMVYRRLASPWGETTKDQIKAVLWAAACRTSRAREGVDEGGEQDG